MDVKCPNCTTEYELDEGRLRPGGVTVKCASCEHVFRVRRRADTANGVPVPPNAQVAVAGGAAPSAPKSEAEERSWLIRLEDGEIKVCRELATLQRWIVSGEVSRSCEISRTGKKWKKLSQLAELGSFFAIAQEAREVAAGRRPPPVGPPPKVDGSVVSRAPASNSHPHTVPRDAVASQNGGYDYDATKEVSIAQASRPYSATEEETIEMSADQAREAIEAAKHGLGIHDPVTPIVSVSEESIAASLPEEPVSEHVVDDPRSTMLSSSPPPPKTRDRQASVPPPPPGSHAGPRPSSPPPAPKSHAQDIDGRTTGNWAAQKIDAQHAEDGGRSGPTGGLSKGVPTADAAFARSKMPSNSADIPKEFENGRFVATDDLLDDDADEMPAKSSAGKWIAIISLLVLAGAGTAVYMLLFKDQGGATDEVALAAIDAAPAVIEVDAAPATAHEPSAPKAAEVMAAATAALSRHEDAELRGLSKQLADLGEGTPDERAGLHELRSRVFAAMAQHALDEELLDPDQARKHARDLSAQAKHALQEADAALEADGKRVSAMLAKADALRLQGSPSREVERWLRKAEKDPASADEHDYITLMLRLRDKRSKEASKLLDTLIERAQSPRLLLRRALVALAADELDDARASIDTILGADSEHEDAKRIGEVITARATPEIPDTAEAGDGDGDAHKPVANNGSNGSADEPRGGSYDQLLERADKAAESGHCDQGVKLYERALDMNPSGVAALTGLGYCHLDFKNFASAQARFRAALGISPRYQDALWGVAEGYQQQGLSQQAIKAYRDFIEAHPASKRAEMARRQIERLGGSVSDPGSGSGDDSSGGDGSAGDGTGNGGGDTGSAGSTGDSPKPDPKPTPEPTPIPKKDPAPVPSPTPAPAPATPTPSE